MKSTIHVFVKRAKPPAVSPDVSYAKASQIKRKLKCSHAQLFIIETLHREICKNSINHIYDMTSSEII